jgi:hypothetical protein
MTDKENTLDDQIRQNESIRLDQRHLEDLPVFELWWWVIVMVVYNKCVVKFCILAHEHLFLTLCFWNTNAGLLFWKANRGDLRMKRTADVPALEESKMLVSCGAEGSVAVTLRSFCVWFRILDVTPAKLLLCLKAHAPTCPWCLIESCRFLSEIKLRIIGAACTQIHVDRYKSGYCRAKGAQVQSRWTIQALLFIFNSRSHSCFDIGHMGTGDVQTHIWLTAIQTLAGALPSAQLERCRQVWVAELSLLRFTVQTQIYIIYIIYII